MGIGSPKTHRRPNTGLGHSRRKETTQMYSVIFASRNKSVSNHCLTDVVNIPLTGWREQTPPPNIASMYNVHCTHIHANNHACIPHIVIFYSISLPENIKQILFLEIMKSSFANIQANNYLLEYDASNHEIEH